MNKDLKQLNNFKGREKIQQYSETSPLPRGEGEKSTCVNKLDFWVRGSIESKPLREVPLTRQCNCSLCSQTLSASPLGRGNSRAAFTLAEVFSVHPKGGRKQAFTLAEVLITLGIIGVVAAMTLPTLIQKHRKQVVETRLKQVYSILGQLVNTAQAEHGDISTWSKKDYVETYILPYIKKSDIKKSNIRVASNQDKDEYEIQLISDIKMAVSYLDGTAIDNGTYRSFSVEIFVDVNGDKKPNTLGRDQFIFYILPHTASVYNDGKGDLALNVPHAGLFWDGYGFYTSALKTNIWRGCSNNEAQFNELAIYKNAYCIALIAQNGWKIPDDYPLKF